MNGIFRFSALLSACDYFLRQEEQLVGRYQNNSDVTQLLLKNETTLNTEIRYIYIWNFNNRFRNNDIFTRFIKYRNIFYICKFFIRWLGISLQNVCCIKTVKRLRGFPGWKEEGSRFIQKFEGDAANAVMNVGAHVFGPGPADHKHSNVRLQVAELDPNRRL